MSKYIKITDELKIKPEKWLVTGVAGFIGSNLLETLLLLNQQVIGLDNYDTGHRKNLEQVKGAVSSERWANFDMIEGDICDFDTCEQACTGVDFVLHQAALGSVPRSIAEPLVTNASNITGFINMLAAARDAEVKRFVYAASSSTYGDHPGLPKVEDVIGKPLSPYAVTKYVNELYADVFGGMYGMQSIGLRYFNVFGRRQDPDGPYAAVIPKWFSGMLRNEEVFINGTGETSRDFCYIDNTVQANILAACTNNKQAINQVYNVACGEGTNLNELFELIKDEVLKYYPEADACKPIYRDFRQGDVLHSLADITKAGKLLDYKPGYSLREGLREASEWYMENL